jgi:DNA-binding NtrC family response regulator
MPPKKVLIIDDDESILNALYHFLRLDGLEVIKCNEMTQAEQAINNTFFDLVVADIRLTGVLSREGLELLSYVKERSPETKVIIMTGYGSPEIEKEAYDKGAFYYFEKPIDMNILKEKIDKVFQDEAKAV